MTIKQELYKQCVHLVEERLYSIQNYIADIQNSLLSETKSSAGDKHETGRAMLQLEREKAGRQLAEIDKLRLVLSKIDLDKTSVNVSIGSLVFTSKANYFIAVSLGEVKAEGKSFYSISPATPIGQLLMGKAEGDKITFNEQSFMIVEVI